jgi:transglutaminase-like putative cysteine protease
MSGVQAWHQHRPFLLPALALWGWQTDLLVPAVAFGVVCELPRVVRARLEISQADFDRLWSFTSVLFLAVIFYLALARQGLDAVGALSGAPPSAGDPDGMHRVSGTALTFLRWLPFILAPFTAAVVWSRQTVLPWSTFSLYEQARAKRQPQVPPPEWAGRLMHPGYLYLGVVLFSASTIATHNEVFLPLLLICLLVVLWPWRNPRWGLATWFCVLLVLAPVAIFANQGHRLSRAVWSAMEERLLQSGNGNYGDFSNPSQISRTTALGQIGTLKQSGAIILRIAASDGAQPELLREASFNRFLRGRTWDHGHRTFTAFEPSAIPASSPTLTITRASGGVDCPLAVPGDHAGLQLPAVGVLEAGGLGALRIRGGLPLVIYTTARGGASQLDEPPETDDARFDQLEPGERAIVEALVEELHLRGLSAAEAGARLEAWFAAQFTYAVYQTKRPDGQSPLVRFLSETRSGHCEFFATATVLLLRAAGIPARYAVGYSVHERAGAGWLARGRDAHAWTLMWNGTRWDDLDTTPASWREAESAHTSWFQRVRDGWAEAWYRFTLWRQEGGRWQVVVFIAGMVILAWIGWRQLRGSAWRRAAATSGAVAELEILGLDSECLALFADIAARHGVRHEAETPRAWLTRLGLLDRSPIGTDLAVALALHQRLRFDPQGLTPMERNDLRTRVGALRPALSGTPSGAVSSH